MPPISPPDPRRNAERRGNAAALWRFSLAFYARPGIAEALIALQDRAGIDVNLALFALWFGLCGRGRLDAAEFAKAERAVAAVRSDIVEPLRRLRRRLKSEPDRDLQRLRARVATLERAAERVLQQRLADLIDRPAGSADPKACVADARANLALYLGTAAAGGEAAILRDAVEGCPRERQPSLHDPLRAAPSNSPQRRTVPLSRPNKSRMRPKV